MTWLKHKGKLINLAHITAIQVEGKEVEFCGEKYESILFDSMVMPNTTGEKPKQSLDATENCAVLYAAKKKKSKASRKKEKRILQSCAKDKSA